MKGNKTFIFLILFALIFSTFYVNAEEMKVLRPSEAIDLALNNNLDLQIAEINLENAEIDYEKQKAEGLESKYNELQAELQIDQARQNYETEKNSIIISVVENYLTILEEEENLQIQQKQKELQERSLEVTRSQYESGYVGRLDFVEAEHNYENLLLDLEYSRRELEQTKRDFKELLGLSNEKEIELLAIEIPEPLELEQAEVVEKIIDNSFGLEVDHRQLELTELDLERAEITGVSPLELKERQNQLKLAELELEKNQREIIVNAEKEYHDFQQLIDRLEMSEKGLEQEKENYEITQRQYEAGIKTENDLLEAEIELLTEENNHYGMIINYLIGELNLRQQMGHDLGAVYDDQLEE